MTCIVSLVCLEISSENLSNYTEMSVGYDKITYFYIFFVFVDYLYNNYYNILILMYLCFAAIDMKTNKLSSYMNCET